MAPIRDRSTPELVMLILAGTVGLLLVASVIMIGAVEVTHPESDTSTAVSSIAHVMTLLTGAVVGFLAGRSAKEKESP